jgi:hypothetical protein
MKENVNAAHKFNSARHPGSNIGKDKKDKPN